MNKMLIKKKKVLFLLKIIVFGIAEIIGIISFITNFHFIGEHDFGRGMGSTIILISSIMLIRYLKKSKCPTCGDRWSYVLVSDELIKTEDISVKVKEKIYRQDGTENGYTERYVPGTRKVYRERYECTNCKNIIENIYNVDKANI